MSCVQKADLAKLDRNELIALWLEYFNQPIPRSLSLQLMRRMIFFEVQIKQSGGFPASTRRRLIALSRLDAKVEPDTLSKGTRLIREWNGVTHIVDITDEGFLWRGKAYRSLSAIAQAITGAKWSGPRFFGTNTEVSNARR
jgi:hypothetical protein